MCFVFVLQFVIVTLYVGNYVRTYVDDNENKHLALLVITDINPSFRGDVNSR